jgi:uncharacterized iron-regulated membrane protein
MKKRNYKFFLRKLHRYLGVFIGIQFLLWTLGGLYFSWTNIHEIRGDHLRREKAEINFKQNFISPKAVVEDIEKMAEVSAINNLRLIEISGAPFYEIEVRDKNKKQKFIVADAVSGRIRPAISEDEAKKIAAESLVNSSPFKSIIYLTAENVGGHHEYREKPLPAWAVTFENDLTVYLSAETGQVGAVRTNEWRIFDFLWMLHTMDYRARDDINNYVLRAFSILGIATILSGFILFFVSSKFIARIFFRRASAHIHDSE